MAGNVPFVKITYSGAVSAENTGKYNVICVCDDNCYFEETGTNTCATVWEIKKCLLSSPVPMKKYPYTGEVVTPEFYGYSPDILALSGETSAVEVGDYTALFEIRDTNNYEWASDVTVSRRNGGKAAVAWEIIDSERTAKIPYQSNYLVYKGERQSPAFKNYNAELMTMIGGVPSRIAAGQYVVVFRLKNSCVWSDGTTEDKQVVWEIHKKQIPTPFIKRVTAEGGMYYYEIEGRRYPVWENYDSGIMTLGGDIYDTDNSWHITYFDLKEPYNYVWKTVGNSDRYTVRWKLSEPYNPNHIPGADDKKVHIPRQVSPQKENGETRYPQWDLFEGIISKIGGSWEGIKANTYDAIVEIPQGYVWEDGTYGVKVLKWKILGIDEDTEPFDLISIHIPVQINPPNYDGLVKTPEWNYWEKYGFDIVEGDQYGMPAGTYYLTLRLQTGYVWEDGTLEDKVVEWVINPGEEKEDPKPQDPATDDDGGSGDDNGNSCCCCCSPCCDTKIFDIFKCPEEDEGCDCS